MKNERHPLRQYLMQNNLNQSQLADRLNVSSPVISNLMNHNSFPTVRRILKYCRDYSVDPAVFFPDKE